MASKSDPKILIEPSTGKKFLIKNSDEDFYTSSGTIKSKDLKGPKA